MIENLCFEFLSFVFLNINKAIGKEINQTN